MGTSTIAKLSVLLAVASAPGAARADEPQPSTVYQPQRPATEPAKNACYFELLGTSLVFSANYERRFDRAYVLRVGTGFVPPVFDTDPAVLTPAATFGRVFGDGTHHLELAAGGLAWAHLRGGDSPGLFATGVIGYRYQPPGAGVVVRVAFTPSVRLRNPTGEELLHTFWPGGGASIGYAW
jgi:hypothetical protein